MKFICTQENLTKALNIVSKAVTSRSTLPILKGIMLRCDENSDKVFLSSSDLEISIETSIDALIEEEGSIVVSSKLFSDIIRKMPQGNIVFSVTEGNVAEVKGTYDEFSIQGINPEEFPRIEQGSEGTTFSVEKGILKKLIRKSAFASSTDESRGIITGVLIELRKGGITFAALDGFRVAIVRESITNSEEKDIVIAGRIIQEIGKILSENENDEDVQIIVGENKVFLQIGNTKVVTRLMQGDFVKYNDILPMDNRIKMRIDRMKLLEGVERASIIVREGKNSFIRFTMEDDRLVISSRAEEGTSKGVIDIDKDGENIEIGFNARYINDTLKAISDEEVVMEFNTSISPCIVRPIEGDYYTYLILPVRLSTTNL